MLKYLKIFQKVIYYLLITILVIVCFAVAFSIFQIPGSYRILMVQSGSMEPFIRVGSVVVVNKSNEYDVGDIITFSLNPTINIKDKGSLITHRIFEVTEEEGIKKFVTKGDANQTQDQTKIIEDQILGKVMFSLPYLGYPVSFAKTQLGFILLVIIPGTIIIYSEYINIKKEIKKIIKKKKDEKISLREKNESEDDKLEAKSKINLRKIKLLIVLTFLSFSQISSSKAILNDIEISKDNIISAGVWGEKPTYPKIVINEVSYNSVNNEFCNDDKNEWIELYNGTENAVNLKDWELRDDDGTRKIINSNTWIPSFGFAVLSHDNSTWIHCANLAAGAEVIQLTGPKNAWLENEGDKLYLFDPLGNEVDFVSWGGAEAGWDLDVLSGGSIARKEKGVDTDSPNDWEPLTSPNPGTNPHPIELISPTPEPTLSPSPEPLESMEPSPTALPEVSTSPFPEGEIY